MSGRRMEAPCNHYDLQIGTVCAGDIADRSSPFCGVATCADCVVQSQGYVQMQTGLPAQPLLTYEDSRRGSA